MRILTAIYGPDRGGSERAVLRLVKAWRKLGHHVTMLGEAGDNIARPVTLARRIAEQPADILFAPGQTYALPFFLTRLFGSKDAPLVTKISNMPRSADIPSKAWLRLQARWTRCFVAPDPATRAALQRDLAIRPERLANIANPAADQEHLAQLHEFCRYRSGALNLLAIGRLVTQKNFALLIAAFATVARDGDRLTILGDGPERAALQAAAAQTPADIHLPGFQTDPFAYFQRANAFALSSDFEGLPAVLIEALAAGLPIAATDSAPAIRQLLGDGRLGLLSPTGEMNALAANLERLRDWQPQRAVMYEAALRFTAEQAAPAYIDLFTGLADSHAAVKRTLS